VKFKDCLWIGVVVSVLTLWVQRNDVVPPGPGPGPNPVVVPVEATAAVYVYEQRQHPVPSAVSAGLNRLNREKGITATLFDVDTTDSGNDVPEQYVTPLDAANKAGLPALVVMNGSAVAKVVKDPRTEDDVMGAVK
jgi:hypothetical protein